MTTVESVSAYRVKPRGFEVTVPHGDGEVTFVAPAVGPGRYKNVGREVLDDGFSLPAGENASLAHAAFWGSKNFRGQEAALRVKDILNSRWLWTFSNVLWTSQGVYAVQDSGADGLMRKLTVGELEDRLKSGDVITEGGVRQSKDGTVRFAPISSYNLGGHTPASLAQQGDVIAVYGVEGARKLGEVSEEFRYHPRTCGVKVKDGEKPELRVSALGMFPQSFFHALCVNGDAEGVGDEGFAFGVLRE